MPTDEPNRLEDLLARYIDRLNEGERITKEDILAENPVHGPEIAEHLEGFIECTVDPKFRKTLGTLGDYTLRRQIGRGGMGVVYEAWQGTLDRKVALKVLPTGVAADDKAFLRFMREAKTAAKLNHQNIVSVYGMGVEQNTPYYSMEMVDGETLAQIIAEIKDDEADAETVFGKRSELAFYSNLANAFREVADGLQHAHSRGVIHRDIKPSNLILDAEGRLRILDFGLARLEGQESLTISGDFLGTVLYMSPEQAMAKRIRIDHRTDIYSFGAAMYEALTLHPPFQGKHHQDTLSQIIFRDPKSPRQVNPQIPKDLEAIVLKCLRKNPGDRYGTAEALGQDLRRFGRGDPIEARPQSGWERLARRAKRQRAILAAGAAFLLILITAAWLYQEKEKVEYQKREAAYHPAVLALSRQLYVAEFGSQVAARELEGLYHYSEKSWPLYAEDFRPLSESRGFASLEGAVKKLEPLAEVVCKEYGHYHLARAYRLLERTEEAKRVLASCSGFLPAEILELELEGDSGVRRGEKVEQLRAQYDGQKGWEAWWLEASTRARERRWPDAVAAYEKLIAWGENEGEPYTGFLNEARLGMCVAHLESRDYFKAQQDFSFARTLVPGVEPLLLLGKAFHRNGQGRPAKEIFMKLYEEAGEKREAVLRSVMVYKSLGDFRKACEWAGKLEGDPIRDRVEAYFLYWLVKTEEAIESGRRAVALNPEDLIAHLVLARALLLELWSSPISQRAEKLPEILGVSQRAVELNPENAQARNVLALAEAERKRSFVDFEGVGQAGEKGFWDNVDMKAPKTGQLDVIGTVSFDKRELYFAPCINFRFHLYVSRRNSPDGDWGPAEPLVNLNSSSQDWFPSISRDGLELYFGSTREGGFGGSDIYVATRKRVGDGWDSWAPLNTEVPINTEKNDSPARLSDDGRSLFFSRGLQDDARTRGWDLYVAWRPGPGQPFQKIRPLTEINTSNYNEAFPCPSSDGKTLFFSDFKQGSQGKPDIWMAKRPDAGFDTPFGARQNVGPPVSTSAWEEICWISWDWPAPDSKLYFYRTPGDGIFWATWKPDENGNRIDDREE